jgi:hypothetical protein
MVKVVDHSGNVLSCRSPNNLKKEWFSNQCEDSIIWHGERFPGALGKWWDQCSWINWKPEWFSNQLEDGIELLA